MRLYSAGGCTPEWVSKIVPLVVCNTCADVHVAERKLTEAIQRIAIARQNPLLDGQKKDKVWKMLVDKSRAWVANECRRNHVADDIWDQGIATKIWQRPGRWWHELRDAARIVREFANKRI